jgi:outer membrane protein assembly factor BamB
MQMDVRTDGNRRVMSSAGMVNQRYLIILKGNYKEIEISSNMELFRKTVKFPWKRDTWYTMKSRVDVKPDGSGFIRAKVWPRGQPEPKSWTIEVPHSHIHKSGAPGIYGFVPQSRFRVYIDNISVNSNK